MQNAAFEAARLDWLYAPLPTPPERLEAALAGLGALGFAGANVTAPHKLAVARLLGAELASVNTILVEGDGLPAQTPVVLGDGGAAHAFLGALPGARHFARRGNWPPDVAGADLVVNATSERKHVLVELDPEQTLIDLPYPETATARAARMAGARVVDGLEVLVAQGAASFELWTGVAAPMQAMRAALGLPLEAVS